MKIIENIIYRKEENNKKKIKILLFSSLIFITNAINGYNNGYYMYSLLFGILTITSLIVHSKDNIYTNAIDKIAVSSVVLYGGYVVYKKIRLYMEIVEWISIGKCETSQKNTTILYNSSIIIITFAGSIYLYVYGYMKKDYCFCDDKNIAEKYHVILHIISSIGHHFIIFL